MQEAWKKSERKRYLSQLNKIIEKHAGEHVYVRFDGGRFSKARSYTSNNVNDHSNHEGIWAYMIEPGSKGIYTGVFGLSAPVVTVLASKQPERILRTDRYTLDDLKLDVDALVKIYGKSVVDNALVDATNKVKNGKNDNGKPTFARKERPFAILDLLAQALDAEHDIRRRYRRFYTKLGYVGIEDPLGLIDTSSWTTVQFVPSTLAIVARYEMDGAYIEVEEPEEEEDDGELSQDVVDKVDGILRPLISQLVAALNTNPQFVEDKANLALIEEMFFASFIGRNLRKGKLPTQDDVEESLKKFQKVAVMLGPGSVSTAMTWAQHLEETIEKIKHG